MSLHATAHLPPLLISPKQLASLLQGPRPLRILDATWFLPMPGAAPRHAHAEFLRGPRVPGALFWDVDAVATRGESVRNLPHMMPSASTFAEAARGHGISRDTHVVVYDTHGIFSSPRTAFTFAAFGHPAVSVLDGGLPAWLAAGEAVDREALTADPTVEAAAYEVPTLRPGWIRSFDEMLHNTTLGTNAQTVLDARPKPRFDGQSPEPRPEMAAGHIPHSISLPASSVLEQQPAHDGQGSYTRMKPQHELWKLVQSVVGEQGLEKLRHDASAKGALGVSLTCGSGMTACILWLALQQLGIDGALYDESWAGWGRRAHAGEAPVEKSEA
ncbi:unnamed protein product [Malassezia sympodialis ATCC 42132]|uniref:Similar to S.cerevisiae protein TUM1 (Rhodanese domain sulfur transferase) n=1 Tax=Malassezia sympodialis (strain ATCC 42132) TaxID=1230383 RepID=M5EDD7_MALS4|nr:uncharacterized protein MSY001_3333 [Malassezia sympodialis ATCC 42132]CCV00628.1 unnamed protein product [Malassezia sympodialis ATCC 42132]SHO79180.1 Similar to S.cerevisiae protein TUM1 (Rhodanese domain sulfur transferase) [Malassezia sympodialis ATCC 42132]|eukprot:XP_018741812.1 uncharacterized protein MSY001_3333 [Malassezia sympodialis ATCC 42132]